MLSYICSFKFKQLALLVIIYALCHFAVQVFFLLSLEETNRVPVLLWWTQFVHINKERVINCPNGEYQCLITTNHSNSADVAAYLFYGSRIENHDFPLPRNYAIPWAILHEESPKNYAPFLYRKTQSIFNITSTFSRYSDFPVTLQYLESVSSLRDSYYYVPVDTKNKYLKDIAPVLYIQSDCDTPINRDYLVKEFGKFINIDSYGKCLTNKMFPKEFYEIYSLDLYNEELLRFIAKYKFIVAFENAICEDYITEKLWRPLIVGSIPIYLGSPTIEDWLPNKNSAILVKNYNSLQEVANSIKKINANDTLYESFLEHKLKSKITNQVLERIILNDHLIPSFECFVCRRILKRSMNRKTKAVQNIYRCPKPNSGDKNNTWDQHWEIGKCQSKALEILLGKNQPYSNALFEETWKSLFYNKNC